MTCLLYNATCMICIVVRIKQGSWAAGNAAAAASYGLGLKQEHQMQQGLLCNNTGLLGMGQQQGHAQVPYGHSGLAPSLAHLGLHSSLMDSL